jgi:hypothetical protein
VEWRQAGVLQCGKKLVSMMAKRHFIRYTRAFLPAQYSHLRSPSLGLVHRLVQDAHSGMLNALATRNTTPLQADQGCGAARARGATSLGHDHGPGGLYCKFELLMRQRNHASWCPAIHFSGLPEPTTAQALHTRFHHDGTPG